MANHKTISLDDRSVIIAGRIPNFSAWVRMKLLEHAREATVTEDARHVAPETARIWGETKDKCNPRHKKGACRACYPDGVDA